MRLSAYIAKKYGVSRSFAKTLIRQGLVPGARADIEVAGGMEYTADIARPELAYDLEDYLIRDDGDTVFFYKPPSMHTERHTPLDPLCLSDIVESAFPDHRLISRLDYGVSGVIAAVRGEARDQRKTYYAWIEGSFPAKLEQRWAVDAHKRTRVKVYLADDGELMRFALIKTAGELLLIEITLEKAHRHQVRAVCAALGRPIIGDALYSDGGPTDRICLHCARAEVNGHACDSFYNEEFINSYP